MSKFYTSIIQLTLAFLLGISLNAQTPANIPTSLWYRADATSSIYRELNSVNTTDLTTVYLWKEAQGGPSLLQANNSSRPLFSNNAILANFNPTLTFDGNNDFLQSVSENEVELIHKNNGTLYIAGRVNQLKENGIAGFHTSMDFPGLHMHGPNKQLLFITGDSQNKGLSSSTFQENSFFTGGATWQNGSGKTIAHAKSTISLNGEKVTYTGDELINVDNGISARDFRIGSDSNYGAFSGQINEVLVYNHSLSREETDRLESYLAIKYGTTLANGSIDYKDSSGRIVWSTSNNIGYQHNIAGIANDGPLLQKQSWSTNSGQQVLIGAGDIASSNQSNTGTLSQGQYIIWGDNGLSKKPILLTSSFEGVSHRFEAIWKVQGEGSVRIAWPKSYLHLAVIQSNDANFDNNDLLTPMVDEVVINKVTYLYADVHFTSGQYFTFAARLAAPGGVTNNLTQWYRADQSVQSLNGDGTQVITWTDQLKNIVSEKIATAPLPYCKEGRKNYFNFNPGIEFTTEQQMLGNLSTQTLENTNFDIFTLTKEGMRGTRYFNVGMNNTTMAGHNWDHPGLYTDGRIATRNNVGDGTGISNPGNINFATTTPSIMYHTLTNTTIRKGINGNNLGSTWNISERGLAKGGHIFGANAGPTPPNGDDYGLIGHIGEVVIYGGGNLTPIERNRVDSYFALKYGITLPKANHYYNSTGEVIWDASENAQYYHNVSGIIHDKASALHQKQSSSANIGQQVVIGTIGLSDHNLANKIELNSGQYLIWGDNDAAKTLSVTHEVQVGSIDLNLRMASVWKVKNKGNIEIVRIAWLAGLPSIHLVQSINADFSSGNKYTSMENTMVINDVTYNYADVILENDTYFTLAGYVTGPGGVPAAAWYRADIPAQHFTDAGITLASSDEAIYQWNDYTGKGFDLRQITPSLRPIYSPSMLTNFHPTISFDGSNDRMVNIPAVDNPILDRTRGALFAVGKMTKDNHGALLGFGAITGTNAMDDPGLYARDGKLVFSPKIGYYSPVSTQSLTGNFIGGTTWENNAGTGTTGNQNYTLMTLNGYHEEKADGISNVINTEVAQRGLVVGMDDWQAFGGQLNELIVFSQRLSETEISRVESYLAIKYGQTLSKEQQRNYVNSLGNPIWNGNENKSYYHNVAALARDDEGSLYQKQSWSTNPGKQVLISTRGLANTNTKNIGTLQDMQYLVWGDNGLSKNPVLPFETIDGLDFKRFAAVWKVANHHNVDTVRIAWPKGLAYLKLIQHDSDSTFGQGRTITEMTNTQIVNGIAYSYIDAKLKDGQFFSFIAYVQAPGGVINGLTHWYRADKLIETNKTNSDILSWTDFTGGVISSQISPSIPLPKQKEGEATYFNFNPGVHFTTTSQMIGNIQLGTLNGLDFDVFTLTKESMSGTRYFNIGMNNTTMSGINWDQPGFYPNGNIARRPNNGGDAVVTNPGSVHFSSNQPSSMFHQFTNTSMRKGVNGTQMGAVYNHFAVGSVTGGHIFGANAGATRPGGDDGGFIGHIGEVIIYGSGSITQEERNKVDSYLAIKYGITLDKSNNYITSNERIVWNASYNKAHYHNIAGIGQDITSALLQKQSRSQVANINGQIIIGIDEITTVNAENKGELLDGQFLMWGDNGNTQSMNNNISTYTSFSYAGSTENGRRMNRVWKVQNTGLQQEVQIRFPVASVSGPSLPSFGVSEGCAEYVIIFAEDAEFTQNVTTQTVVAKDGFYDTKYSFPNDTIFFTYGKIIPFNKGTVYLPSTTEKTNDHTNICDLGEWTYFRQTGNNLLKLVGVSGLAEKELNTLEMAITTEGTDFDNNTIKTNLMSRITTVHTTSQLVSSTARINQTASRIRIYYSIEELTNAELQDALTNGWYSYTGDATEVMVDIYNDGLLNKDKAIAIRPLATGIEDEVNYVEFAYSNHVTTSFIYLSSTHNSALPVKLIQFEGKPENDNVALYWITSEEINNSGFAIEHSTNLQQWSTIGFIPRSTEKIGISTNREYEFMHSTPLNGANYYRLKQIDINGSFEYSNYISILIYKPEQELRVYPNPISSHFLTIQLPNILIESIELYDMNGVKIPIAPLNHHKQLDVSHLSAGIYLLKITSKQGDLFSKIIIKQ